jgi:hypothetical protein
MAARCGYRAEADRRGAGDAGGNAGVAWVHLGVALAAPRSPRAHLRHLFRYLPQQPGYNKRLRAAAGLIKTVIRVLSADTTLWTDDVWVVDSTPVECGRSRETTKRSDLAGWAEYGYCASHSRYFWGLRLHLVCTLGGLPVGFALTGAKADERQTLLDIFHTDPALTADRPEQIIIGDKNYFGTEFETTLAEAHLTLLRPARKGEPERPGAELFKPLRQTIESINQTFKGQLDLERHGGHTPTESSCASYNASSPWSQPSGTTTKPIPPSTAPSPPTTTDPLE